MTDQTNAQKLAALQALIAELGIGAVTAAVKAAKVEKATNLSVTSDAFVAALVFGPHTTEAVTNDTTARGRIAGLFKSDESAQAASVAHIMRHQDAFVSAVKRAKLANDIVLGLFGMSLTVGNADAEATSTGEHVPATETAPEPVPVTSEPVSAPVAPVVAGADYSVPRNQRRAA